MPLMPGSGMEVIGDNIRELIRSYKRSGMIGTYRPKDLADAMRHAQAIAYNHAGKK